MTGGAYLAMIVGFIAAVVLVSQWTALGVGEKWFLLLLIGAGVGATRHQP